MNLKGSVKTMKTIPYHIDGTDTTSSSSDIYHFNDKGLIDSIELHGDLSPISYSIKKYIYNDNSQLINTVHFIYEDGIWENYTLTDWRRQKMFYNNEGQLVKIKEINQDTVLVREVKFKYDDRGRLLKEIDSDLEKNNEDVTTWTYTENGSRSMFTSNDPDRRGVKYYDNSGMHVKSQWYIPKRSKEFTEYKYTWISDEQGNWIQEITSSRDVSPSINEVVWVNDQGERRFITYYK
jgi:hypothetical protein